MVCLLCPSLYSIQATWEDISATTLTHLSATWEWQWCCNIWVYFLLCWRFPHLKNSSLQVVHFKTGHSYHLIGSRLLLGSISLEFWMVLYFYFSNSYAHLHFLPLLDLCTHHRNFFETNPFHFYSLNPNCNIASLFCWPPHFLH